MATEELVLQASLRNEFGKGPSHRLRVTGRVPAVVYAHGKAGTHLSIPYSELAQVIHQVGLLSIKVDNQKKRITAVIKDHQVDVLRGHLVHVDFQEVRADEVITATIPVHQFGTPAGEAHGAILDQQLHEIDISCPANRMLEHIEVDVSELDMEQPMLAGDIELPEGIELQTDPEETVFTMYVPQEEEEETGEGELQEEGEQEPEVIGKGKAEEEEGEE